jgi:predicted ATP-grasp superfamily ATP-dependent carboligase
VQSANCKPNGSAQQAILIVAASGRMLAQSAIRAGLKPVVIDLFGDCDTRELAVYVHVTDALTVPPLAAAIDCLSDQYAFFGAVYGSGLEKYPQSLEYLYGRLRVFGNSPKTFRRLHDKVDFFKTIERLGQAYPETIFAPPATPEIWLRKPSCSQGGAGIYLTEQAPEEINSRRGGNIYWQRYVSGVPMSVLFLADAHRARIIGFNRQWTIATAGAQFVFSGIVNDAELPQAQKSHLNTCLQKLTGEFSLSGLNGLDFIWDGRQAWILEINPRPPASLALYDACYEKGLLAAHLAACGGTIPLLKTVCGGCSAYKIVYAPRQCVIPAGIKWPDWAIDRPRGRSSIRAGQPICSIMATCASAQEAMILLRTRKNLIFNLILASNEHAIHSEC